MGATVRNVGSSEKRLSAAAAGYLAGFFDGEGCLTIGRTNTASYRAGVKFFPVMMAAGTDLDGMLRVQELAGNGRVLVQDRRSNPKHKPLYRLDFTPNQIRHLLPQIRPYLLVKGRQADILSEFLADRESGQHQTADDVRRWERWRSDIRTLNKRGIDDTPPAPVEMRERRVRTPGPKRPCQLFGCVEPHFAKDYCQRHYKLYVLRGGPKKYDRECVRCGKVFVAVRSTSTCCSKRCRNRMYYEGKKALSEASKT